MAGGIPFLTQERGHTLVKMLQDLTRDHYRMLYAFRNVSSGNASFQQQRKRMEETTAILEEAQQIVLQQHALHRKFLYSATSVIPVIAQTLSLQKRGILAAVGLADDDKHSSEDGIAMEGYSERKEARKLARQVGTAITACNELMVGMQRSLRRLELATLKDLKSVIIASVAVRLSKWHLCGLTPAEWAKLVVFCEPAAFDVLCSCVGIAPALVPEAARSPKCKGDSVLALLPQRMLRRCGRNIFSGGRATSCSVASSGSCSSSQWSGYATP